MRLFNIMKAISTLLEKKRNLAEARLAYNKRDAKASAQVHGKKELGSIEMGG